jgi:hypothetical protein
MVSGFVLLFWNRNRFGNLHSNTLPDVYETDAAYRNAVKIVNPVEVDLDDEKGIWSDCCDVATKFSAGSLFVDDTVGPFGAEEKSPAFVPFPLLSAHAVTLLPDSVSEFLSAASNHSAQFPSVLGSKPEYRCEDFPTADIVYKRRRVFDVTAEITSVCAFPVGMTRGLARDSVLVSVMLRLAPLALRSVQ